MSETVTISTHVLDTALGKPAANVAVSLERVEANGAATLLGSSVTDADGRVSSLVPHEGKLAPGDYRLRFDVERYFNATGRAAFYAVITIDFRVSGAPQHYHVPLLLSPFGYATYRGS